MFVQTSPLVSWNRFGQRPRRWHRVTGGPEPLEPPSGWFCGGCSAGGSWSAGDARDAQAPISLEISPTGK